MEQEVKRITSSMLFESKRRENMFEHEEEENA